MKIRLFKSKSSNGSVVRKFGLSQKELLDKIYPLPERNEVSKPEVTHEAVDSLAAEAEAIRAAESGVTDQYVPGKAYTKKRVGERGRRALELLKERFPDKSEPLPFGTYKTISDQVKVDPERVRQIALANGWKSPTGRAGRYTGTRHGSELQPFDPKANKSVKKGEKVAKKIKDEVVKVEREAWEKDVIDTVNGLLQSLGRSERIDYQQPEVAAETTSLYEAKLVTLTCDGCGIEFQRRASEWRARKRNFHNRECYVQNSLSEQGKAFAEKWNAPVELSCAGCGVTFKRQLKLIPQNKRDKLEDFDFYHSAECFREHNRNWVEQTLPGKTVEGHGVCGKGHSLEDAYIYKSVRNGQEYTARNCRTCTKDRGRQYFQEGKAMRQLLKTAEKNPDVAERLLKMLGEMDG